MRVFLFSLILLFISTNASYARHVDVFSCARRGFQECNIGGKTRCIPKGGVCIPLMNAKKMIYSPFTVTNFMPLPKLLQKPCMPIKKELVPATGGAMCAPTIKVDGKEIACYIVKNKYEFRKQYPRYIEKWNELRDSCIEAEKQNCHDTP